MTESVCLVDVKPRCVLNDVGSCCYAPGIDNNILYFFVVCLRWYGHVLRKEDTDWVKKCMEYEVEGSRPRGRSKRTWKEVVQKRFPSA